MQTKDPVGYKPYEPLKHRNFRGRFNPRQPIPAKHLPSLRYAYGAPELNRLPKPGQKR